MPALALDVQLRQNVAVLPQLVLRSELLGLSGDELETRIQEELESNPALELDERGRWQPVRLLPSYSQLPIAVAEPELAERMTQKRSLRDDLLWQLRLQPPSRYHDLCAYLIHSVAPDGYLQVTVEEVAAELETPLADVQSALQIVQSLSPTGVGARDLRECLLLQTQAQDPATVPSGTEVFVREHLHSAIQGREHAARSMRLSLKQVDAILEFIRQHLSPYPGLAYQGEGCDNGPRSAKPDVILGREADGLHIEVPESVGHSLRINAAYSALELQIRRLPRRNSRAEERSSDADRRQQVIDQVRQAQRFIANLQRRYEVLQIVTEAIVEAQAEFIDKGPEYLHPLDKKVIAARVDLHESTVCRATRGKYIQMPDGVVVPFDIFFDDALPLRCLVRYLIQREDPRHCLSDDEIAARLREGGHVIARRTVAKYRGELGIPTANERRKQTGGYH